MIRKPEEEIDDPRRALLIAMLKAGVFTAGSAGILQPAWSMGRAPKELIPGKSIYDMRGTVKVNDEQATMDTKIDSNDTIITGRSSHVIFAVGKDAFILRSNSKLSMSGGEGIIDTLRLVSGKLLSVFGKTRHKMRTPNATIGIRGTGIYVEAGEEQSYVCTCYGVVDLAAVNDGSSTETIASQHHDAPRYILSGESPGNNIRSAPFINHTDMELQVIEGLVGREPPFNMAGGGYSSPRRTSY